MKEKTSKRPIGLIVGVLILIFLLSIIFAGIISVSTDVSVLSGNVALIPIKGIISVGSGGWGEDVASSEDIMEFIEKADENPNVKAIILDINSPGGSAVASEEITNAVKKTNKTTIAVIREVGASGGYWVASAADHVIANRMSITGSVGVFASYLEFAGLLENYNVTYQRIVSGKYKDLGSPLKELTREERNILQKKMDLIHSYFIDDVAENRELSKEQIKKISSAEFYLGSEALDLGLIDELGGKEEAITYIEKNLNITAELSKYEKKVSLFEALAQVVNQGSFNVGKGIGSSIFAQEQPKIWS